MAPRRHMTWAVAALLAATTACGVPTTEVAGGIGDQTQAATNADAVGTTTSPTDEPAKSGAFDCPVTIPTKPGFVAEEPDKITYSKNFPAPDPWPEDYPHQGMVWYGSEELWTALDISGDHGGRKSVWWSSNFLGGIEEGEPEVWVTWTRLDADTTIVIDNGGVATNAYTPEEGWFMIAGGDPAEAGCWQVKATYKGASLSYVYEAP